MPELLDFDKDLSHLEAASKVFPVTNVLTLWYVRLLAYGFVSSMFKI